MHLQNARAAALGVSLILTNPSIANEGIELSEYLEKLRQEFIRLASSPNKEQLPLRIDSVHVELTAVAKKEGSAGIKFYVVDTSGKLESAVTQKLSFDVNLGKSGEPWITSLPKFPPDYAAAAASKESAASRYGYMGYLPGAIPQPPMGTYGYGAPYGVAPDVSPYGDYYPMPAFGRPKSPQLPPEQRRLE